jgi:phage terminase small subunit
MGKRGPRPRPTELKRLHHTLRTPDRRRGPDAMAPAGGLVPPNYFTAELRERWAEILRLAPMGVLRPVDSAVLVDFVVNEGLARRAYLACGDELTIEGEKSTVRNPLLLVYFKATEAKRAAMRELGFTPAARVGLPVDEHPTAPGTDPEDLRWAYIAGEAGLGPRIPSPFAPARRSRQLAKKLEAAELADAPTKGDA